MKKTPIFIFSNDWHLKENNLNQIQDLFIQKCELAKELNVTQIGVLGDIFDSRKAQTQDVLQTFLKILDIAEEYKIDVLVIAGNHDRSNYNKYSSFLEPFKHHPSLDLIEEFTSRPIEDTPFVLNFIPFFEDQMWLSVFNKLNKWIAKENYFEGSKHILCSHIAVNGSVNNDGSKVESTIKPSLFKDFYKVFLGHYHNSSQPADNIYHLPSIQQNNFGEDNQKGFTVLYSDGSHELVKSKFKEYIKVKVDINNKTQKEVDQIAKKYAKSNDNVRVELTGTESQLKSIKKDAFKDNGIDVKNKTKEVEDTTVYDEGTEVKQFDPTSIKETFVEFCEENELDLKTGNKYLNKKLPNE